MRHAHAIIAAPLPELSDLGPVARRALRDGARGSVGAVFERSFYLVLDGQWICVGPHALGAGPLNALYDASATDVLPPLDADVSIGGDIVFAAGAALARINPGPELPPFAARPWSASTIAAGLRAFDELAPLVPDEGLGRLAHRDASPSRVAAAARAPVAHLQELVMARLRDGAAPPPDIATLSRLLGLGPGLTPSGDDLLGGALVALAALGLLDLRDAIWAGLRGEACARTNEISFAHLSAAAEGECAPALRSAVDVLMSGAARELPQALERVAAIGHSSGWDALAGAVVVLRAYESAMR